VRITIDVDDSTVDCHIQKLPIRVDGQSCRATVAVSGRLPFVSHRQFWILFAHSRCLDELVEEQIQRPDMVAIGVDDVDGVVV